MMEQKPIACGDGCKATVRDEEAAMQAGWSFLSIARRWRCPTCATILYRASSMPGTAENPVDKLAPDDRGGLPMPGGFGIVPVQVKG